MKHDKLLKAIKGIKTENAQINVFFGRRYALRSNINITLHSVTPGKNLVRKIRETVNKIIQQANNIIDYEPETTDQDEALFLEVPKDANWEPIATKLLNNDVISAKSVEDIKDTDLLIADLIFDNNTHLVAVTHIPEKLTTRRLGMNVLLFNQGEAEILEEQKKVMNILFKVDFFVYDNHVFIAEKKEYEKIMNIREGMLSKRDDLVEQAKKTGKFEGVEILKDHIGDNMTLLRRAAKAKISDNLSKENFINELKDLIKKYPQFKIEIDGKGKIVITEENADAILFLLNDARAETLIKKELVDIKSGVPVVTR